MNLGFHTAREQMISQQFRTWNVYVDQVDGLQLQLQLRNAYGVIVVNGSLPTRHVTLEQALKVGGRLFAVIGDALVMQAVRITRMSDQNWRQ